jgi:hypothetical protein
MIIESSQMDHMLRPTIQGGGTTLIFLGSRTSQQIREELLIMLKINILPDSLQRAHVMVAWPSQHQHLLAKLPLKPQHRFHSHWKRLSRIL